MDRISAEIARMQAVGFKCTPRPGFYHRKSDGRRVRAVDWPDGDVTWILDPLPVIAFAAVGTCSAKTFERNHVAA